MTEREVDAALAEHLFGWHWLEDRRHKGHMVLVDPDTEWVESYSDVPSDGVEDVPHYSTTWEGMGLVVEAMDARKPRHTLNLDSSMRARSDSRHAFPWFAEFWTWEGCNRRAGHAAADTAPMAVALAALRVLGVGVPAE